MAIASKKRQLSIDIVSSVSILELDITYETHIFTYIGLDNAYFPFLLRL